MNWIPWIGFGAGAVAVLVLRRKALVGPEAGRQWLARGAQIIDVRSGAEYHETHIPQAVNIPLNRLREEILQRVRDKEQPLLLRCLSGARSGMGMAMLRRLGYRNAFILGSQ